METKNKVAVITGGGSGLGEASARDLARAGAKVVIGDVMEDQIGRVVEEIRNSGGKAAGVVANVTAEGDMARLMDTAIETFSVMYDQVKLEESSLMEKLEVKVSFDEDAVDEIISQAIQTGQEPGTMTFQLAKRLEYGLRLVKDRAGMDTFIINAEAVTDTERFINELIKQYYREE